MGRSWFQQKWFEENFFTRGGVYVQMHNENLKCKKWSNNIYINAIINIYEKELKSFSYTFFLSFFSKNDMLSTLLLSDGNFLKKIRANPPGVLFHCSMAEGSIRLYTRHNIDIHENQKDQQKKKKDFYIFLRTATRRPDNRQSAIVAESADRPMASTT